MKKLIFISILILCFSVIAFGQMEEKSCPEIILSGPSKTIIPNEIIIYSVSVSGKAKKYSYKWSVSGGKIISGQGTAKIKITADSLEEGFVVTIKILGLPKGCDGEVSETGISSFGRIDYESLDNYENLSIEEEIARFDNLFITLNHYPGTIAYVLFNIREDKKIADVEKRFSKLSALFKQLKLNSNLLIYDVCRSDMNDTTFWVIGNGVQIPYPEKYERVNVRFQ